MLRPFRLLAWLGVAAVSLACGAAFAEPATQKATFAGGCFWCMEPEFSHLAGVSNVAVGYTGGTVANPTYEQVSGGNTGHVEAIEVTFDPAKISYDKLLDIFWENVDPTDEKGQFCDHGTQYRAGIFTHDEAQKKRAEASKTKVQAMFSTPLAAFIKPASTFYPAEDYHQQYSIKNKMSYTLYRTGCGRDAKLESIWHDKPIGQ